MSMRYPGGLIATTPVNQQYPSGVWTGPQASPYQANNVWGSDPFFRNTTLLLQGSGSVAPFNKDSSANNFNVAINGDTRASSYTPFQGDGYYSNYFDGSGDYLTCSSSATNFSTASFTIEFWVNFTSLPSSGSNYNIISATVTNGVEVLYRGTGSYIEIGRYGVGPSLQYSWTPSLNAWNHVAFVRNGTTVNIYINGTSVASGTVSQDFQTGTTNIGSAGGTQSYFAGYLSNLRVVKNTAVYTSNFTPSTTPLTAITNTSLLTCADSRFVDDSTNAFAITSNGNVAVNPLQPFTLPAITAAYGSGYFDGSGDYLSVSAGNNAFLMSGNWTLACWIYPSTVSGVRVLIDTRKGSSSGSPVLYTNGTNLVIDTGSASVVSAGTITINQWQHVAATRSGNSWRLYLNGVQIGSTTTNTTTYSTEYGVWIGNSYYSEYFSGYMSNVQILNGTALYTGSTYTVPTNPLAGIANTSLLTLQSNVPVNNNTLIAASPSTATMIRGVSTTQGSFSPFITNGYWSNYFNGSSDYLTVPDNDAFWIQGDFTFEAWIYQTYSKDATIIGQLPISGTASFVFRIQTNGKVGFFYELVGGSGSNGTVSTGAITFNTWNHVVWTRSGTTFKYFINGVQDATTQTISGSFKNGTGPVTIGLYNTGADTYMNGYISNARFVNGTAVYSSNFTPSTTPLTAIANTSLLTCQSNRFIDNSANAFTVTTNGSPSVQAFQPFPPSLQYTASNFYGSASLVSGDYFQVAGGSPTSIGNFSASAWIYRSSVSGSQQTFCSFGEEGPGRGVFFWTGSNFEYNIYGSSSVTIDGTGSMPVGAWTYVVLTRTGSTLSLYYNGSLKNSVSLGTAFTNTSDRKSGYGGVIGYVANYRLDYAAYSSPTTVPTAPVSATANTLLLANFTNAGIYDSTGQNDLVTVGDVKLNTSVVKYGTGSMYFDGTGDYLQTATSPNLSFGSGNFTMEMWFYQAGARVQSYPTLLGNNTSWAANLWDICVDRIDSVGKVTFFVYNVSSTNAVVTSASTIAQNTWYHLALVRNGSTMLLFLNGVLDATGSISTTSLDTGNNYSIIGSQGGSTTMFAGYIDDLRITKGVARYVTNFTPPVARMPNQ